MRRCILLICWVIFGFIGAFSVGAQDRHSRSAITPDNSDQVTQLVRLGRGVVNSLVWSPDGNLLAMGTTHGAWLTNPTMSDAPKQLLTRSPVGYFVFSADSRFLAAGTTEGLTWVWKIDANGVAHDYNLFDAQPFVPVAFSPDGQILAMRLAPRRPFNLAIWEPEHAVTLWNVQTGEQLARLDDQFGQTIVFADDDCLVAGHSPNPDVTWTTSDYGCILLWNGLVYYPPLFAEEGRYTASVRNPDENNITVHDTLADTEHVFTVELDISRDHPVVISTDFSPGGTLLAVGGFVDYRSRSGVIWILDALTGEEKTSFLSGYEYISEVSFSPDGSKLATADLNGVEVWDVQGVLNTSANADEPQGERISSVSIPWLLDGHRRGVFAAEFSPDSTLLVTVGGELVDYPSGTLYLWDVATGSAVAHEFSPFTYFDDVTFHPYEQQIVYTGGTWTGYGGPVVSVWDLNNGESRGLVEVESGGYDYVTFSPDGTLFATAYDSPYESETLLWDFATETQIARFEGNTPVFSPDGSLLAYHQQVWNSEEKRYTDSTLHVWDIASQAEIFTLDGFDPAFSPDGRWLAYADDNGAIHIWDCAEMGEHRVFVNEFPLRNPQFDPDSARLAVWDDQMTITILIDVVSGAELGHIDTVGVFNSDWSLLAASIQSDYGGTDMTLV